MKALTLYILAALLAPVAFIAAHAALRWAWPALLYATCVLAVLLGSASMLSSW